MTDPPHVVHLPRLLEVHEVAYHLKCSHETVRRLIREGKLPAIGLTTRSWRVDPADLHAFVLQRKTTNGNGNGNGNGHHQAPPSS